MIRCWICFLALATGFELVAYVNTKVDGFSWQQLPWNDVTTVINIKGDAMDLVKTAHTHGSRVLWNIGPENIQGDTQPSSPEPHRT